MYILIKCFVIANDRNKRGKEKDILKKQQLGNGRLLSFGLGEDKDNRNYEERLDEPYVRLKSGSKV